MPLADIEPPPGADIGDVVKAVKNLYSLLRQMEQALRGHELHPLVTQTASAWSATSSAACDVPRDGAPTT